jgi:hypothetical protein
MMESGLHAGNNEESLPEDGMVTPQVLDMKRLMSLASSEEIDRATPSVAPFRLALGERYSWFRPEAAMDESAVEIAGGTGFPPSRE